LGVPFNTTQYAVLTHMIAQATGLQVGQLTHIINNAHIYENQIEGMREQLERYERLQSCVYNYDTYNEYYKDITHEEYSKLQDIYSITPKLKLNPDITNFYDFTIDGIALEDYKNMGIIKMKVSV